ncbi:MAG: hypothetical protein IH884_01140, partial [Myxococcales bacterium]|nr:hypothetical protein [Myxococcales bacterium]
TRDVADAGWLPRQVQVGLTGRAIAPELYIAVGVRGDFNHMVGIQKAGTIIAINTNNNPRRAPILNGADYTIIPDRVEAGTFMAAVAITKGQLTIKNCPSQHLLAVIDRLRKIGVHIETTKQDLRVTADSRLKPTDLTTLAGHVLVQARQPARVHMRHTEAHLGVVNHPFGVRFSHVPGPPEAPI